MRLPRISELWPPFQLEAKGVGGWGLKENFWDKKFYFEVKSAGKINSLESGRGHPHLGTGEG